MPRKKSATKKAKEQALKQSNTETGSSLVDTKVVAPTAPNDQTPESHSESTTSDEEEEDEFGDLITDEVERGINKVLEK